MIRSCFKLEGSEDTKMKLDGEIVMGFFGDYLLLKLVRNQGKY